MYSKIAFIFILGLLIIHGGFIPYANAGVQDIDLVDITPDMLLSHSAIALAVTDSTILTLGAGNRLLNVYDVRDIVNPRRITALDLPFDGRSIAIYDDYVYILCPGSGVAVVNIKNLLAPKLSGMVDFNLGPNASLILHEDYLYLHDGRSTLRSFAMIRPWEFEEASSIAVPDGRDMVHRDDHIYITGGDIKVIDISDPTDIKLAGEYHGSGSSVWGLAVSDDLLCAIDDSDTLTLLRATGDGTLTKISDVNIGQVMLDVVVSDDIVAIATADNLITFDISKPEAPKYYGSLPLMCELRDLEVRGDLFFLASELDGPLVVDASNPLRQRVIAYQAGLGLVSTIASRGSLMLTGSWDSLRALERFEEGDVQIVGIQHSEGFTKEMQITGDFAYLADPSRGLRVFNVSRPVFMKPVALLELPGTPSDVELVGTELAFIALGDEGVAQVNIHYPFSPVLRMHLETDHPCTNITKAGDFLYFIGPDGYIDIYDISIPTQPRQAAWMQLSGIHPIDAVVRGELLAISGGTDGLWLFNVADPIHPVLRSKYITDGSVETADIFDGGAILEVKGPGFCKMEIVDLRYVFAPYKRDELSLKERSDYRDKIHVVGDRAYLAAYNYGMKIFEMKGFYD